MDDQVIDISKHMLKSRIRPSLQRIKIFECLLKKKNHPTVDDIYTEVVKDIPTLSKTTVYNTLKLFLEANLVRCISIENDETRYDHLVNNHGHFKCNSCGKIYDFPIDIDSFQTDHLKYFQVAEKNVYFKGTCERCMNKR